MLFHASGTFKATAADLYFSLGFVPDWVKVRTLVTTDEERLEWSKNMRGIAAFGGQAIDDDGAINLADALHLINYIFKTGDLPDK